MYQFFGMTGLQNICPDTNKAQNCHILKHQIPNQPYWLTAPTAPNTIYKEQKCWQWNIYTSLTLFILIITFQCTQLITASECPHVLGKRPQVLNSVKPLQLSQIWT